MLDFYKLERTDISMSKTRRITKKCKYDCLKIESYVVQKWNKNGNTENIDKIVCPYTLRRCKQILSIKKIGRIKFKTIK